MMVGNCINLFVVEDNKFIRTAVAAIIAKVSDFRLLGFAEDGEMATPAIIDKKPDVALIDIGLPVLDGIEVTRRIKAALPKVKVIMLTASDSDLDVVEALNAGADGYLLKEVFGTRLEMAVRAVRLGAVWLDPAIAKRLLVHALASPKHDGKHTAISALSTDDVNLLGTVAQSGCANGACLVEPEFLKKLHASFSQAEGSS